MRYMKKIMTLLLVSVIILTYALPANAEENYVYSGEAQKLYALGLYKGISTTEFVPDLGSSLTREQGVAILIRILGEESEALSISENEAIVALSHFKDRNKISSWAVKYVAYGVKNNMIDGYPDGTFLPQGPLLGKDYCKMLLSALGYEITQDVYKSAAFYLVNIGGLTFNEAAKFNDKQLIRDDVVGISYGALKAKFADGKTVIANLVERGVITEYQAIASGAYENELMEIATNAVVAYENIDVTAYKTVDEFKTADILKAAADAAVSKLGNMDNRAALQRRIDAKKQQIDAKMKEIIENTNNNNKILEEAKAAVDAYLNAPVRNTEELKAADELEMTARVKVYSLTSEADKQDLLSKIEARKAEINNIRLDIENWEYAKQSVNDYLNAPYDTLEQISNAEQLEVLANTKIALVKDEAMRSSLSKQVAEHKLLVNAKKVQLSPPTVEMKCDNLMSLVLTFSKEIDKTTLTNSIRVDGAIVSDNNMYLDVDNRTLTIVYTTPKTQSSSVRIDINGLKDINGVYLNNYTDSSTVVDKTLPVITGAVAISSKIIRVYVSEPINLYTQDTYVITDGSSTNGASIRIDGLPVYAKIVPYALKGYFDIQLMNELTEGGHTLDLRGIRDYAGYAADSIGLGINVILDKIPPYAVSTEIVSNNKIKVTFNEMISGGVTSSGVAPVFKVRMYGDTYPITVSNVTYTDNVAVLELPQSYQLDLRAVLGYDVIYSYVSDMSGNYTSTESTISGKAEDDTINPYVVSVTVESDNSLKVVFSEKVNMPSVYNFLLLNADGTPVSTLDFVGYAQSVQHYNTANPDYMTYKVKFYPFGVNTYSYYDSTVVPPVMRTITYNGTDAKDYIIQVKNVVKDGYEYNITDMSMRKNILLQPYQTTIRTYDNKPPVIEMALYSGEGESYKIDLYFSEEIDAASAISTSNYFVSNGYVTLPVAGVPGATVSASSDYRHVTLYIPNGDRAWSGYWPSRLTSVYAIVKDKNGNYITGEGSATSPKTLQNTSSPSGEYNFGADDVYSVEAINTNTIKITLKNNMKFATADRTSFQFIGYKLNGTEQERSVPYTLDLGLVACIISDSKDSVNLIISRYLQPDGTYKDPDTGIQYGNIKIVTSGNLTKNQYGIALSIATEDNLIVKDAIKPSLSPVTQSNKTVVLKNGAQYDPVTKLALEEASSATVTLWFTEPIRCITGDVSHIASAMEVKIGDRVLIPFVEFTVQYVGQSIGSLVTNGLIVTLTGNGLSYVKGVLLQDLSNLTVRITNPSFIVDYSNTETTLSNTLAQ